MHTQSCRVRKQRQMHKHFYIYNDDDDDGGGIMRTLGLNKAPVGKSPRGRTGPENELVQLELRAANVKTHTAFYNPELLRHVSSSRHSDKY